MSLLENRKGHLFLYLHWLQKPRALFFIIQYGCASFVCICKWWLSVTELHGQLLVSISDPVIYCSAVAL